MKTALTSLILLGVAALNTIAEDTSQWGLPEGAVARFGRGILYNAKYFPDGRHVAVVSSAGVWLYDAVPGDPIDLIRCGNTFDASDVVFSRDGSTLAAGSDEIVCVWDAATRANKYPRCMVITLGIHP
ncbi:MAG: WD40 repeat domain-containing protein [Candidatus Poribacteria bacterium]|nr:WD40 repeat domain-containing protein [Candidatus Poribacteria bacterium]MDE0506821.1 WD40 repeat domain-containing protein [Candidatus Poribacteria bacterium]